jgi:hypothetical protein
MFDADKNSWSTVKGASLAATNNGDKVYVYDAGRPVIDVPTTNAQKQADVLSTLCGNANATCTFTPTAQSEYFADPKFSMYYVDPTSVQQEFTAKFSHTTYKRMTRTISVPAGGARLSYWKERAPPWNSAHR